MAVRSIRVKVGDRWYTVEVEDLSTSPVRVNVEGETFYVEVEDLPPAGLSPRAAPSRAPRTPPQARRATPGVSESAIRSPMPGRVLSVSVRPGEAVSVGQELCVVEAMKMEQVISAPRAGVIKAIHVQPLQQVGADDLLVELE